MTEWRFICSQCRGPLLITADSATCVHDNITYPQQAGIWRLLPPDRSAALDEFITHYETVRRAEDWGASEAAYYRALPFADLSGRRAELWRTRAQHYERFLEVVLKPIEQHARRALRVLDLGTGNGWLAYRMAQRGHQVAAIDLSLDQRDGLGAHHYYDTPFTSIQAEFDRLPLADDETDVATFNGALHYAPNVTVTLSEALRVAHTVVVIDSPCFKDEASGAAMLAAHAYGFQGLHQPIGFLTERRLQEAAAHSGASVKIYPTDQDPMKTARRKWTQWRIGREPARFPIIVFARGEST